MPILTHITKVKHENLTVKTKVQDTLGWSSIEYAEFQEKMGLDYLIKELEGCSDYVDLIAKEKLFWSWWINHWVKRDIAFLVDAYGLNQRWCRKLYMARNNPNSAYFNLSMSLMKQSYAVMIGKLIKEIHND